MPTYEYRCPDGHDFEKFVMKISNAVAELPCPTCGKPAERCISAGGGLLFKGSGFYITDYGKDGKKDQRPKPGSTTKVEPSSSGSSAASGDAGASSAPSSAPAAPSSPAPKSSSE
ncbi:MAG: FmdB family zinc ribbon protein [bacterium]|jgi:putative FmdB family regulatory protein